MSSMNSPFAPSMLSRHMFQSPAKMTVLALVSNFCHPSSKLCGCLDPIVVLGPTRRHVGVDDHGALTSSSKHDPNPMLLELDTIDVLLQVCPNCNGAVPIARCR